MPKRDGRPTKTMMRERLELIRQNKVQLMAEFNRALGNLEGQEAVIMALLEPGQPIEGMHEQTQEPEQEPSDTLTSG